ncbi:cGMP-dependent protein kinase 1 isoform X2 [Teleopsis dalmanni]|uniref:cGMP-dependent protein kinase 1 isoform X2 n=1 Tax=Teleopsis dalmanni TaxID=139649 RepID=UPI0018CDA279|nr:cGMP-dependent protein kinase 1 isoform X2 [Teleopsis dalmanni]
MSCFPRLFHRSKSSFNPAIDDNDDTVLNNSDSPVQIGLYIRREETPVFTPKSSERSRLQQQNKSDIHSNTLSNNNSITSNNNIISSNYKSNNNSNTNSNSNSSYNDSNSKKFISNKTKHNNNNQGSSSNHVSNVNLYATPHSYSNNKSGSNNHAHIKLKPVKERRPTALPTEAPGFEQDDTDGTSKSSIEVNCNGSSTAPTTPTTPSGSATSNAKFFIGVRHDEEDAMSSDISATTETMSKAAAKLSAESTQTTPKSTTMKLKFPSNLSNSSNKTRKGARRSHEQLVDDLHIPPPPPMPPQPLTTASSSASLVSHKSNKSRRSSNALHDTSTDASSNQLPSDVERKSAMETAATNVKDQSSSPKDSDSSESLKSHRIEGGLIFARPKFPIKNKDVELVFIEKDEATRNLIRTAIEKNEFLNNYMDKERKEMVIDAMEPETFQENCCIIKEGDEGAEIFVSESGSYQVTKDSKVLGTFNEPTVFGELAILYNAKRLASVKATSKASVWKIHRETFRKIMVISGSKEREENLNFLKSAPLLRDLEPDVLNKVVDLLQRKFYSTNACIVCEGEVGNEFFIIRGGTVTIKKKNAQNVERVVDRRKRGDYFGEQALLNADRRQASVFADAPGTEVLVLDREAFISYLGTIPQLREKPSNKGVETRESNRKSEFDNEYANIQLTELKKVATLGAGAFGRVDLVSYGSKTFALKIIKKIDVVKQDQIEHVYNEKHVMMKCRSSLFIIELYKTFRNEKFVYFLMEACMGGDVWTIMSQRRFFDEKTARFVAGCVVEAFDFLHSHNIIYRDLKPENLMLTTDGYCKLVDFGFAKHIPLNQKTNTFAGTPEYVAPEIILDRGHDRSVDYWALGILIFELLVGKTPFRGQNQIKIYQQILGGIDVIQMPSKIPKSAQGLIKHLCKQLPAERLGYQRKGILDIKKHSWFDNFDWNKLKAKQLVSPIKRPIKSNTDLQYFGPPGVDNDHDPPDETSGWDKDF